LDTYVTIPGVKNDKPVWLPKGETPENKPANMDWHKKGSGPFTPNQWGYDTQKAAEALAKREQKKSTGQNAHKDGKGKSTGQTTHKDGEKKKSKRATKREKLVKKLREVNELSIALFERHMGFDYIDPHNPQKRDQTGIFIAYELALKQKKAVSTQVMTIKDHLKKQYDVKNIPKDQKKAAHVEINQAMHKLIATDEENYLIDLAQWDPILKHLNNVCSGLKIANVLGTQIPEQIQPLHYYTSVAGLFLSKVKRQLMEIALARVEQLEQKNEDHHAFIRYSEESKKTQEKLIALKKYHALPEEYPDTQHLEDYHAYILKRETAAWHANNPDKDLP
jgi:hypothetical protein